MLTITASNLLASIGTEQSHRIWYPRDLTAMTFTVLLDSSNNSDSIPCAYLGLCSWLKRIPPCSVTTAAGKTAPGDTVYLISGTYRGYLTPPNSGNASNWITYSAAPGALPIFDGASGTAVGISTATYIRFVGIVSRNHSSGGFSNPWTDSACATMSASNRQYINCIADGNQQPSWSSGVNLFHVTGDDTANQVIGNVSFENIDVSTLVLIRCALRREGPAAPVGGSTL